MLKLKHEFTVELELEQLFPKVGCPTKLIPFSNARAILFGWGSPPKIDLFGEQYWFAEINNGRVAKLNLPMALTDRLNESASRRACGVTGSYMKIQAFKLGERVGLLLGTEFVYLFDSIHEEPKIIEIDNPFSTQEERNSPPYKRDKHYFPTHCGNALGNLVPVVLHSPSDSGGEGRHACLLEIDPEQGQAQWLYKQADGHPYATLLNEYQPYATSITAGGLSLSGTSHGYNPPLLADCAFIDGSWHLYAAGFNLRYVRNGISPAVLTRNAIDLSMHEALFVATEASLARICASLDRLIVTPYHKSGPHKGKQTIYLYQDKEEHDLSLPRGHTKKFVEEYYAGYYWLLPNQLGYGNNAVTLCSAAG